MDLDATKDRHALLKRKATESISDIIGIGQSSATKRQSQLHKLRDFEAYKSIIKTYKAPVWYGCAVSPRDLADFGWACVKKNTVKCVECEQILSTILPKITTVSINVYNTSLKFVHEKMVSAHRPTCRQRAGAPAFRLVEPTSKEILDGIEERLASASSFSEDDMIVEIPTEISLPKFDNYSSGFVFVSALGWKISKSKRGYIALNCDHCARELIIKCGMKFDPIHNHERWCPRVDKNDNGEPSWQTDLNIVLNTKNKTMPSNNAAVIIKNVCQVRRLMSNSISSMIPS